MLQNEKPGRLGWSQLLPDNHRSVWVMLPGATRPLDVAGDALSWPLGMHPWPAEWGTVVEDDEANGGLVFEPWAVADELLKEFAAHCFERFEADEVPPFVLAWRGVGGWRMALIDPEVAAERIASRALNDLTVPCDAVWAPLPELRLLPVLAGMWLDVYEEGRRKDWRADQSSSAAARRLRDGAAVLADWFADRGDEGTAEALRSGQRRPLEVWGPADEGRNG
jgi:hypothetical protein